MVVTAELIGCLSAAFGGYHKCFSQNLFFFVGRAMPQCFKCGAHASVGDFAIWGEQKWLWVRNAVDQWQESLKNWKRQSQAVWNRPDCNMEACDIYCLSCWKDWGRHVKPGCTYALGKACEELAVRVGIQLVYPTGSSHVARQRGNPFYCPHCKAFYNNDEASLEKHLLESHSDQVCAALTACLHKRKADAVAQEDSCPPALYVSCGRRLLTGKYTVKRWNHGKPLYQKADRKAGDLPVVIYFWDSRDGEKFHGWWFSPCDGSRTVWAYNSSNLSEQELTVPTSGWTFPWNGEVDQTLNIATSEVTNEHKDEFELRWEFVASVDGEREDWKPMSKDMNDALEKHWLEGWHGDTFHIQANGYTYAIDCQCMVQWNLRSNRRRYIRRGEVKPDVSALLPKLVEKDNELQRLQTEKNALKQELNSLMLEKNNLAQNVMKLELLGQQLNVPVLS